MSRGVPVAGPFPWRDYLAPRHWPTWLGLGALRLIAALPFDAALALGRRLGPLVLARIPERAAVADVNLRIAFPTLEPDARARLARDAFRQIGMAFTETAWSWYRPIEGYADRFELRGAEHLDAALARGRGVILLQAHFTLIDLSGHAMCTRWPMSSVYDPPKNPLWAAVQRRQRERWMVEMIPNRDVRSMVRRLRAGEIVWFSPDQYVPPGRGGIETRYFDRPVSSSSGTARMLAMTGAALVPLVPERSVDGSRYTLTLHPAVEIDARDTLAATQAINDLLEAQVRGRPEQYLWVHKRFKPPRRGMPDPYARGSRRAPPSDAPPPGAPSPDAPSSGA